MKIVSTKKLEEELEHEKARFLTASRRAAGAIQRDLKISNWFRQYPMESALAIIGLGFFAGYVIQQKRSFNNDPIPPQSP
jgi:hypothetical protein